jgi:Rap1a immunity proteins
VLANKRDGKRGWCPWARKLIGAVVVWVAACGSGWAQDGNELLKRCLEPVGESWSLYCAGYLRGVSDALMLSDICVHEGVGYDYIKVVVVRYLQAHPEIRDHNAIDLVRDALVEAFPCQR